MRITVLLIIILLSFYGCSTGENEPSKKMIIDSLEDILPGYIKIKDIHIEISKNIRSRVEPLIRSRFSADAILESDFVHRDKYKDKYGENFKIYGISKSDYNLNKWQIGFEKIQIEQKFYGSPLYTESLMGGWEGVYVCGGEERGLKLRIYSTENKKVEALFNFYPLTKESKFKVGSFMMKGSVYNWGGFKFTAEKWIERPKNYHTLDLKGQIDSSGTKLIGTIPFQNNCSTFEVTKSLNDTKNFAESLMGNWEGVYFCGGKERGLRLSIYNTENKNLEVLFNFYPLTNKSRLQEGSFIMNSVVDNWGGFMFTAKKWIKRPKNYHTLDLKGQIDSSGSKLIGTIPFQNNCSTFELTKTMGG
ncbi:MAG: hypothetical protein AB2569_13555 [Candidatus Thiodiazotropha endolucinida]